MTALSETKGYQAYPEYKDSGVEWSDALPLSWGTVNLRWISTIYAGGTPSKTNQSFWENGTVPWINSGAVNQGLVTKPSTLITEQAYQNSSAKWIPKGSLVIALAGQGKTKGMVAQLAIDSTCNQSMGAIVPECSEHPRYLYWWLTSNYQNIRNMAGGDLRDGLNLEHLGSIQCPQPSIDESVSIANFLDHETAKIDTLIEKQQQLIKLLKEKRQAVISHAVTKGLNPQAPMKDSGVEWLGEVPEHWQIKKIKHFGRVIGGYAFKSGDFVEQGYPVIKITNVSHLKLSFTEQAFLPEKFSYENSEYIAPQNSLVFAMTRPIISGGIKVAKMPKLEKMPLINQRVGFLKIEDEDLTNFILLSSLSNSFVAQFKNNMTITNQPNISSEGIESVSLPLPPTAELKLITDYLNNNERRFNKLIKKSNNQVEFLQERRTALISAAVTGKIDVRHFTPKEGQAPTSKEQALEQTA
ncbi:restriction endonuclease subunit S [Vibrio rumoiensis]|uniref:restriction endonuclease subunit S n=1 Tax=Vibrio rumoiensis TaxID=76258 RepID=UPI003AA825F0